MLLGSMGYAAQVTTDFEEHNCLIEAILCALHSQSYLIQKSDEERKNICRRVRQHLVDRYSLSDIGYPRLSHVEHFRPIIDYLLSDVPEIWRRSEDGDRPTSRDRLVITAQVLQHGDRRQVHSERSEDELRWMEPVRSSPVVVEEIRNCHIASLQHQRRRTWFALPMDSSFGRASRSRRLRR